MPIEVLIIAPFCLLLLSIATLPLLCGHWWEKNYKYLVAFFTVIPIIYYVFFKHETHSLIHTAQEYISFICLIGSLFVVAGGIHIQVKGEAKPLTNCIFLFIGAVLANFVGTTGASMILIRPWIRMNKYRITAFHIIFFIFVVSNVGGCLTPIGDPPLFLGYLRGVPFFWVLQNLWMEWAVAIAIILAIFFVLDYKNFMRAPKTIREIETAHETWQISGKRNVLLLLILIGSVFINNPPFLREGIMLIVAVVSYKMTPKLIHDKNNFNFAPIKEVAILFVGIFATMIPALEWLAHNAHSLGINTPGQFYWGAGALSSVLDNAPTYLNFISAAQGLFASGHASEGALSIQDLLIHHPEYVRAISLGAVFFGAMTYIGNGPNFLVKSIATQQKVETPSFFEYIWKYSLPVLLPIFFIIWLLFIRS